MQAQMIKILVDRGADVQACTSSGDNVLHVAFDSASDDLKKHWKSGYNVMDFFEVVEILVHLGCNPAVRNSNGKMPIHVAVAIGDSVTVQRLLELSRGTPLPSDILLAAMELTPGYKRTKISNILMMFQRGMFRRKAPEVHGDKALNLGH
ncbi:hypothetical protein PAXINDRAFT_12132 [Paxillus involutus ATCC 200175]|uniref:Uncharacterized protein n=1 Tax=Paxillus involutus ATCC 200175 TaxID=664439 RepID=A0A0C9SYT9_PAXIN|nr:hypothetical protein PAXINDRAFT_12132 [Paxillus involutus ATCC 200175]